MPRPRRGRGGCGPAAARTSSSTASRPVVGQGRDEARRRGPLHEHRVDRGLLPVGEPVLGAAARSRRRRRPRPPSRRPVVAVGRARPSTSSMISPKPPDPVDRSRRGRSRPGRGRRRGAAPGGSRPGPSAASNQWKAWADGDRVDAGVRRAGSPRPCRRAASTSGSERRELGPAWRRPARPPRPRRPRATRQPGELAGAGGQVEHPATGAEAEHVDQQVDRRRRVATAGPARSRRRPARSRPRRPG